MRLICPNCGAQYEVPSEVIPEAGRDVQCSDCGDTWYQHHPDFPPDPEEPSAQSEPDWSEDTPQAPPAASQDDTFFEDDAVEEDSGDPDAPEPAEAEAPREEALTQPTRRELDPSIRDVLREEAEREEQARQSDMRGGVETQQELGIEEVDGETERRNLEARARMARLRGLPDTDPDPEEDEHHDIDPSSRRNLLPDIEEINSSLGPERVQAERKRAEQDTNAVDAPTEPPEKSAFRRGFRIAILAAVVALMVYVFAPRIVQTVPALTDPMAGYVELINSGRLALAQMVENLAESLGEDG